MVLGLLDTLKLSCLQEENNENDKDLFVLWTENNCFETQIISHCYEDFTLLVKKMEKLRNKAKDYAYDHIIISHVKNGESLDIDTDNKSQHICSYMDLEL